jgi:hypothetical protein
MHSCSLTLQHVFDAAPKNYAEAGIHPRIAMEGLGHSSIRVTLDTHTQVIGGLQEPAAQRFDDFVSRRGTLGEDVGRLH